MYGRMNMHRTRYDHHHHRETRTRAPRIFTYAATRSPTEAPASSLSSRSVSTTSPPPLLPSFIHSVYSGVRATLIAEKRGRRGEGGDERNHPALEVGTHDSFRTVNGGNGVVYRRQGIEVGSDKVALIDRVVAVRLWSRSRLIRRHARLSV